MIFMCFLARSSRTTGPKIRVPIGSSFLLTSTAALLSKLKTWTVVDRIGTAKVGSVDIAEPEIAAAPEAPAEPSKPAEEKAEKKPAKKPAKKAKAEDVAEADAEA